MLFSIEVTATVKKILDVSAENLPEAIDEAKSMVEGGEVELDFDNVVDVSYTNYEEE